MGYSDRLSTGLVMALHGVAASGDERKPEQIQKEKHLRSGTHKPESIENITTIKI
jgi:hypothetical protein